MSEKKIECPKCHTLIPFSLALRQASSVELKKSEERLTIEFEKRLSDFEKKTVKETTLKIAKVKEVELEDLRNQLKEETDRATEAQQQELKLRAQVREVEKQKQEMDLEVQRQVEEQVAIASDSNAKKIAEDHSRQLAEKEKKISDMHKKLIELERQIGQNSQQTQGEVAELALEKQLVALFPHDEFVPVPKGKAGADIIQIVKTPAGGVCGKILWECKQTKAWSDAWVPKLKQDQLDVSAEIGAIVTTKFPKVSGAHLSQHSGIWVCDPQTVPGLAVACRTQLLELHLARSSAFDQLSKSALVYTYLTGPMFKQRIEAIVTVYASLLQGIGRQKTAFQRIWAKQEKDLESVIKTTVAMWGDLEGLSGGGLQKIAALELPESGEMIAGGMEADKDSNF